LVGLQSQSMHSRTLIFDVPAWPGHLPGQHVDIRLTASDGYSAQRSYSLADVSTPNRVAITVDLLLHGEVSPYLVEVMELGDALDVRGPVGKWFVWEPGEPIIGPGPVLLIAGGSGVVPLMTMLRARNALNDDTPTMLIYSLRGPRDLMYERELEDMASADAPEVRGDHPVEVRIVYTRKAPDGHPRRPSHMSADDLRLPQSWPTPRALRVYVCGPSGFVDHAARLLHDLDYPDDRIRTERFGPTGANQ
jgi:ferredoxin-NADP reductase